MLISRFAVVCALAIVTLVPTAASAATFTTTSKLHDQYFFPDLSTPYKSPKDYVGVGTFSPTFNKFSDTDAFSLIIGSDNITLSRRVGARIGEFHAAIFNGAKYSDLTNSIAAFLSISINGATNVAGFDLSRLSFDENNFAINLQGLNWGGGERISLDFNVVAPVPLPAALPPLIGAIGGLGVFQRWRRRRLLSVQRAKTNGATSSGNLQLIS